jgi:hypothetical protein
MIGRGIRDPNRRRVTAEGRYGDDAADDEHEDRRTSDNPDQRPSEEGRLRLVSGGGGGDGLLWRWFGFDAHDMPSMNDLL